MNIEINKNIDYSLTALRSMAIFLIVFFHSDIVYKYNSTVDFLWFWMYDFCVPLLLLVSGIVFTRNIDSIRNLNIPQFYWKKFKRLMVPYLVISIISYFPKLIFSQYVIRPVSGGIYGIFNTILYPFDNVIGVFWFLPILFMIFIIFTPILKYVKHKCIAVVLCIIIFKYTDVPISFLGIRETFQYSFFWLSGVLIGIKKDFFIKYLHLNNIFLGILLICISAFYQTFEDNEFYDITYKALICALGFYALAQNIPEKYASKILVSGKFTYTIYLLHWIPQVAVRTLGHIYGWEPIVITILMFVTGLVFPIAISLVLRYYSLDKNTFIKLTFGL